MADRFYNDRDCDDHSHFFIYPHKNARLFEIHARRLGLTKDGSSDEQADIEKSSIDLDVNEFIDFLALF
jgi:hypothetical protein